MRGSGEGGGGKFLGNNNAVSGGPVAHSPAQDGATATPCPPPHHASARDGSTNGFYWSPRTGFVGHTARVTGSGPAGATGDWPEQTHRKAGCDLGWSVCSFRVMVECGEGGEGWGTGGHQGERGGYKVCLQGQGEEGHGKGEGREGRVGGEMGWVHGLETRQLL